MLRGVAQRELKRRLTANRVLSATMSFLALIGWGGGSRTRQGRRRGLSGKSVTSSPNQRLPRINSWLSEATAGGRGLGPDPGHTGRGPRRTRNPCAKAGADHGASHCGSAGAYGACKAAGGQASQSVRKGERPRGHAVEQTGSRGGPDQARRLKTPKPIRSDHDLNTVRKKVCCARTILP